MCLKNINTSVVFFDEATATDTISKINLNSVYKDRPDVVARYLDENKQILKIDSLQFLFSVNASEKSHIHEESETPDNTFYFDKKYEIRFRITETHSGKFFDLADGPILDLSNSQDKVTHLCRYLYEDKMILKYENVLVAAPEIGKNLCVLKVLIRRVDDSDPELDLPWVVQSMHQIKLNIKQ